MDGNGAQALKRRIGPEVTDGAPPAPVDVPEDAPPVYRRSVSASRRPRSIGRCGRRACVRQCLAVSEARPEPSLLGSRTRTT